MATKTTTTKSTERRLLDRDYKNITEMKAAPFNWTDEELEALKTAPRTREAFCAERDGKFVWPLVDGHRILFGLFTRQEKDYYHLHRYTDEHKKRSSAPDYSKWADLLEFAKSTGDEAMIKKITEMMPRKKDSRISKLFDVDDVSLLTSKVTLDWILYRGKDEARGSNPETFSLKDAIKEFGDDFHPAMTRAEVDKIVSELEAKGTLVRASIIGL